MNDPALIVFLRPPELGRVKTRLAAEVGPERALEVYVRLVEHTLEQARRGTWRTFLWYSGVPPEAGADVHQQVGDDLGARMRHAFDHTFAAGHGPVGIIGTDCPGLSTTLVTDALVRARRNDVVIGPATDGGYYLLALQRPQPQLFSGISWSTPRVLDQTCQACEMSGLRLQLLPPLGDVDRMSDLHLMSLLP